MKEYFFGDELSSMGLGNYNPVSMRVRINKTHSEEIAKHEVFNELNDLDCTTLFHEYIHHLQNTSTITGIQHLDLQVSMWHNTRCYMLDANCMPEDAIISKQLAIGAILKAEEYKDSNKQLSKSTRDIVVNEVLHLDKIKKQMDGLSLDELYSPVVLNCKQDENNISVKFGIFEFQESSANFMEGVFCEKINQQIDKLGINHVPYKLIQAIQIYLFPKCKQETLLSIILTALQHVTPHKMFIKLLHDIAKREEAICKCKIECHCSSQIGVREECEDYARKLLRSNLDWAMACKKQIYKGLPNQDKHFGDLIKIIISSILDKIQIRCENPFPEIDFLKSINPENFRCELEKFILKNGGCGYYVADHNLAEEEVLRPIIIGSVSSFNNNNMAWMTFEAAMHYTKHHYIKTDEAISIVHPGNIELCPLQKYCEHKSKVNKKCKPSQHQTATTEDASCAYQLAIFKTKLDNA